MGDLDRMQLMPQPRTQFEFSHQSQTARSQNASRDKMAAHLYWV